MFRDLTPRGKKVHGMVLYVLLMMLLPQTVSALTFTDAYWQYETLKMQIPSEYSVTESCILNEEDSPVVEFDVSYYNEQALHDAFGYESEEECVRRYLMYTFLNEKGEGRKVDIGNNYPLYLYECMVLPKEENAEEMPVVLALLVDKEAEKIYGIFFENEMANLDSATEFLRHVTINHDLKKYGILLQK